MMGEQRQFLEGDRVAFPESKGLAHGTVAADGYSKWYDGRRHDLVVVTHSDGQEVLHTAHELTLVKAAS